MSKKLKIVEKYQEKAKGVQLPAEAQKAFNEKLEELAQRNPRDPSWREIQNWLDLVVSLPWNKKNQDNPDLTAAEKIFKKNCYGLREEVKNKILEILAVQKLGGDKKGLILCFVGPPGTGKTSVGKSIAWALDRKFVRISLGGIKDKREIIGSERTGVGIQPGIIISEIKRAGTKNLVFVLDEIDKIYEKDLTSALLEVLDPEENSTFFDRYLGLAFNLSEIIFICTAHLEEEIPPALKDRMEILEFPGYTSGEKLQIAKQFIIPKQLEDSGLRREQVKIENKTIDFIITNYTDEAGVRNLEKEIKKICRYVATKVTEGKNKQIEISRNKAAKILGPRKYIPAAKEKISEPGMAIGLAVTTDQYVGCILYIEVVKFPTEGKNEPLFIITGNVKEIMTESANVALSFIRANAEKLGIPPSCIKLLDGSSFHIHVPEATIQKDGPSAGLTILVSIISSLREQPVKNDVAITGEITLRGKVTAVGGVEQKLVAAAETGIKTVILPKENEEDLKNLPKIIKNFIKRKSVKIKLVSDIVEAVDIALPPPKTIASDYK